MGQMLEIIYRGFYDIPLMFFVRYDGGLYLFDCPFDDDKDEYSDNYQVYLMPELLIDEREGSWEDIHLKAIRKIGSVPTSLVKFDSTLPISALKFDLTLRKKIDRSVFDLIKT